MIVGAAVQALASALCDTSIHAALPASERPCTYHQGRALAALTAMDARGWVTTRQKDDS